MTNLRAGLIGLGMMGRHHARVLAELDGVDLVVVADPQGDQHGAARGTLVVDSVEELIRVGVDYCVVAVPTAAHEEMAVQLVGAGVHVLIEKPLAVGVDAARRIVAAVDAAGVHAAVGHVERYNPALQSLRSRLAAGDLGAVYQIATRRQGPFPARIADVGVVKDLATHDLDLTAWIAGSRYSTVSARTAHKSDRHHEDLVAIVGTLADGTVTNHLVNWLSPMKERVTVVTGERGAFVADTLSADLTFYANGTVSLEWDSIARFRGVSEGDVTRFAIPKPEPLVAEHASWRDLLLGRSEDGVVSLAEGLHALAVAEAVVAAAESGGTQRLSPG